MINRHKRSLILSFILGDGCLHYIKNNGKTYGGLTLHHGIEQSDYVAWKANIISHITGKKINLRSGNKGKSIQFQVTWKRLRVWRNWFYPNGKKSIAKILKYLEHPEFAVAVWLMDDGYCETSSNSKSSRFRIFTCSEDLGGHDIIIKWFQDKFNATPKIKYQKTRGKSYSYIKFTQEDSLKIWKTIREVVLGIKSMRYKFRHIENCYQYKDLQRKPEINNPDDIVRHPK